MILADLLQIEITVMEEDKQKLFVGFHLPKNYYSSNQNWQLFCHLV